MNNFLSDYKIVTQLLNNSSFKDQIKNDYNKYALEIYKNAEKIFEMENNDSLLNNTLDKYQIDNYFAFGRLCYYGIFGLIESNKEKSLNIFNKAY